MYPMSLGVYVHGLQTSGSREREGGVAKWDCTLPAFRSPLLPEEMEEPQAINGCGSIKAER